MEKYDPVVPYTTADACWCAPGTGPANPECPMHGDGDETTPKLSPAERLRVGRCLANVQRLQSEFWQALRDLEDALSEICDDTCELNGSADFNEIDVDAIVGGRGWEGRGE